MNPALADLGVSYHKADTKLAQRKATNQIQTSSNVRAGKSSSNWSNAPFIDQRTRFREVNLPRDTGDLVTG